MKLAKKKRKSFSCSLHFDTQNYSSTFNVSNGKHFKLWRINYNAAMHPYYFLQNLFWEKKVKNHATLAVLFYFKLLLWSSINSNYYNGRKHARNVMILKWRPVTWLVKEERYHWPGFPTNIRFLEWSLFRVYWDH